MVLENSQEGSGPRTNQAMVLETDISFLDVICLRMAAAPAAKRPSWDCGPGRMTKATTGLESSLTS